MPSFKQIDKLDPADLSSAAVGSLGFEVTVQDFEEITVQFIGDFGGATFDVVGKVGTDPTDYSKLFSVPGPGQYRVLTPTLMISTRLTQNGSPPVPVTGWVGGRVSP